MDYNRFISSGCGNDYGNEDVILFNADCFDIMPNIKGKSIDMIFCDLPYGTTACSWDIILPFDKIWAEYTRIIKDTGVILLNAIQPFTSLLVSSNIDLFRYEWIWGKPQGTNPLNAKVMPLKNHESVLVFFKKRGTYNPIMTEGLPYKGFHSDKKGIGEIYGKNTKSIHKDNKGVRYPLTIQYFKHDSKKVHPTQKPVDLIEYFIKTYTNKGDIILDNCMGSGTTGIGCRNLRRFFIGIEKEEKYFSLAKERILDYNYKLM